MQAICKRSSLSDFVIFSINSTNALISWICSSVTFFIERIFLLFTSYCYVGFQIPFPPPLFVVLCTPFIRYPLTSVSYLDAGTVNCYDEIIILSSILLIINNDFQLVNSSFTHVTIIWVIRITLSGSLYYPFCLCLYGRLKHIRI